MIQDGVSKETAEWMHRKQHRCAETGSTMDLEIHHRFPRGDFGHEKFARFLAEQFSIYERTWGRPMKWPPWGLHDRQNLVVLSREVHKLISDGHRRLFEKYLYSFTCPVTGFIIHFDKNYEDHPRR